MSRRIHLVRHGSHDEVGKVLSGRSEIGLNAAGQAEARAAARRLRHVGAVALYSSPRARATETAAAIGAELSLSPTIAQALDEIDFGRWTGSGFDSLANDPDWRFWNAERATARAGGSGETMAEAVARAVTFLEGLPAGGAAVCVSHCDLIRGVAAHCLGLSADRLLAFDCDPASVTVIEIGHWGGRVVSLNVTG